MGKQRDHTIGLALKAMQRTGERVTIPWSTLVVNRGEIRPNGLAVVTVEAIE